MSSLVTQTDQTTDEVLGTLAHELRQPLSTIEAIAYYLSMILPPDDAKIQPQLARIRELVEQSNLILSDALGLSPAPAARPQTVPPGA
jgi:signal transduction histidine kinase